MLHQTQQMPLSIKQVKFLTVIAKNKYVQEITSQNIIAQSAISTRGLSKIYKMLLDKGYVEREADGVRISDPFFA